MSMFGIHGAEPIRFQRRDFLGVGAGLAVSGFLAPQAVLPRAAGSAASGRSAGRARSCILVYLLGGPPHQDMFDLKPEAPAEVRGPFRPVSTSVPGVRICEHLPRLARLANRFALVRSVSHPNHNHTPMIYYTLTGRQTARPNEDNDVRPPQRSDFPHVGAVVARLKPGDARLPRFVAIPELAVRSSTQGEFKRARTPLRGGGAGFLGARYDALNVNGAAGTAEAVPALGLPAEVSAERYDRRAALLSVLEARGRVVRAADHAVIRQSAVALTGAASRGSLEAFTLDGESAAVRDRYGRHRFGQSMLLARRLVEAGVPLVAIHWNEMTVCDGWDTHSKNFEALKGELLPMLDQGMTALLEDLDSRGLLGETVVACFGEFGRTPRINAAAGRDHWGSCSTTFLAGGGIRGGQVYGASDRQAAYPVSNRVDPADVQATIYHALGLDPHGTLMYDGLARPHPISEGRVIEALL